MSKKAIYLLFLIFCLHFQITHSQPADTYWFTIRNIDISGNRITHPELIYRELEFRTGDSLQAGNISEKFINSENNLRNTFLFNFVKLRYRITGFDILVSVEVVEKWYIWPGPILEPGERTLPAWLRDPDPAKLNYGGLLNWNNFRGRKELLQLKFRFGYKEQFALQYSTTNLDSQKKHGLIFKLNKFRQHEIILRNENDQPVYLNREESYLYEYLNSQLSYIWRPGLYFLHTLSLGYNDHFLADDLNRMEYLGEAQGKVRFFDLSYSFEYDRRDYKIYPLHGHFIRASLYRQGLGLIRGFNYKKNYLYLTGSLNKEIFPRFYTENAGKVRITNDEALPGIFEKAIGYETYLRGYEYYIINGNSYYILLNNVKYALLSPKSFILPAFRKQQFNKIHLAVYSNLFFDLAWVDYNSDENSENQLNNKLIYSTGLGIDLVSYYDQVIRLEFTLNSLGNTGIYLHLETPFRRW